MPYFGGADGRVALRLVLQIAENPDVTATVVHYTSSAGASDWDATNSEAHDDVVQLQSSQQSTKAGGVIQDSVELRDQDSIFFDAIKRSLPVELTSRIIFETVKTSTLLEDAIARATAEVAQNQRNAGDLIVVGKRAHLISESPLVSGPLGATADRILERGLKASVLVVQARNRGSN